jgi:hypothetical protein
VLFTAWLLADDLARYRCPRMLVERLTESTNEQNLLAISGLDGLQGRAINPMLLQ